MYAIIYWVRDSDDEIFFITKKQVNAKCRSKAGMMLTDKNKNQFLSEVHVPDGVWVSETLKEADKIASKMEKKLNIDCRVISIEGVID